MRKIVKITHKVVSGLKLELHPAKTYIGRISKGFNFLGFYMDEKKILPAKETIRRFRTRATALYEPSQTNRNVSRRSKRNTHGRDISEYQVNEPAPTEEYMKNILSHLLSLAAVKPDRFVIMRRYVRKWALWLKLGLSSLKEV